MLYERVQGIMHKAYNKGLPKVITALETVALPQFARVCVRSDLDPVG